MDNKQNLLEELVNEYFSLLRNRAGFDICSYLDTLVDGSPIPCCDFDIYEEGSDLAFVQAAFQKILDEYEIG